MSIEVSLVILKEFTSCVQEQKYNILSNVADELPILSRRNVSLCYVTARMEFF